MLGRHRTRAIPVTSIPQLRRVVHEPFGVETMVDIVFCATVLMHNVDDIAGPLIAEMCRVAGETVVLFEEFSPHRSDRYSYVKRTVDQYAAMCQVNGYALDRVDYLHHEILQKLCRVPRRLLNPRGTHEGATARRGPSSAP